MFMVFGFKRSLEILRTWQIKAPNVQTHHNLLQVLCRNKTCLYAFCLFGHEGHKGEKVITESPSSLSLERTRHFIFLPEATFDLLHFHCFQSLVAAMFGTERLTTEPVFVGKQRI